MNEMTATKPPLPIKAGLSSEGGPLGWIRGEIDRLFEDFGRPAQSVFAFSPHARALLPVLELADGGDTYWLSAELPGLGAQDVELELADGVLTISGEKKDEADSRDNGFLMSERRYGKFTRRLPLPSDVDPAAITAKFENGVLQVMLGKDEKAAARSQKIAIAT